jgi:hypothetical protein
MYLLVSAGRGESMTEVSKGENDLKWPYARGFGPVPLIRFLSFSAISRWTAKNVAAALGARSLCGFQLIFS